MTTSFAARIGAAAGLTLMLAACGSTAAPERGAQGAASSATATSSAASEASPTSSASGSAAATTPARSGYVTLADYRADQEAFAGSDVVLFFHAGWCPKCRETKENLLADPGSLPAGLAVVEVDFDAEQELRSRYGVTVQHTFVQVDAAGEQLAVWTGTFTGQDIAAKVV
jgi:thiol-disulfide isomerase/thioredoxin